MDDAFKSVAVWLWMTSRLRLCNSATRHGAVRAKCRCVAVRTWLRANVQQLSDAVAVDNAFSRPAGVRRLRKAIPT